MYYTINLGYMIEMYDIIYINLYCKWLMLVDVLAGTNLFEENFMATKIYCKIYETGGIKKMKEM